VIDNRSIKTIYENRNKIIRTIINYFILYTINLAEVEVRSLIFIILVIVKLFA